MEESDRVKIFNSLSRSRRKNFVEKICGKCRKLKWDEGRSRYWCEAYNSFYFLWGQGSCPAIDVDENQMARECFAEDQHKELLKPSSGEKQDRTHKLFGKDRMKDNRSVMWDGDLS